MFKAGLEEAIVEQRGRELPRFMKYTVCEGFIQKLVNKFHQPSFDCLDTVDRIVSKVLAQLADKFLKNYPQLAAKIKVGTPLNCR